MNTRWTIIEKTIAVLLIVLTCLQLYEALSTLKFMLDIGLQYGHLTRENISFVKIFKNYHLQILSLLVALLGATLLLFNKKLGWILSAAIVVIQAINIILIVFNYKGSKFNAEGFLVAYLVAGLIILFYLASAFLLLQPPFRIKYAVTNKSWLAVLLVVLIFFIDKIKFR